MWSEVDSSMTLHALLEHRDRDNRFLSRKKKKKKKKRLSSRPSSGGGRDALTLSRSSSLSLWAGAAFGGCCGCRCGGWMQGAALGDEQAGRCNRRTGGGSSCPPRQEVLDRLSLLLCSRELLGHVTGCVAEEASLGYRNLEEPNFVGVPMSTRHSQRWRSWTTSVDIARPRDRVITFVTRGARSGAGTELFQNFRIVTTPVHVPQCFSLKNLQ